MSDNSFRGLGIALITPFNDQGEVDFPRLEILTDRLIKSGVDYIVVLGTTAETPALSEKEKIDIRKTVAGVVNGQLPLVLGFGSNCTAALCESLRKWNGDGYDAILSVTPFYNKPTQRGLYCHFKAVAEASPLPVILYNVPGRTGVNMLPETTLRLANEVKGIIGIKEASGNLTQVEEIVASAPKGFSVISGDDGLTTQMIELGAVGVISVIGNAAPNVWSHLTHLALDSKVTEALELQNGLEPLVNMLFKQGNPPGIKGLMSLMGLCENNMRLPMVPIDNDLMDSMRKFVVTYPNLC